MDFTIHTDWIDRATKPYSEAADGDTIVATRSFYYGSTFVPGGAAATYRNGNITELADGQQFALDGLGDLPVNVIPSALDYPAGEPDNYVPRVLGQTGPDSESEPHMMPDVINRADVERVVREFASGVFGPGHAQRLIDRLPKSETGHEVKVAFYVQAASQHDANEKVRDSLPNDLDAVILS